jgi:hypothetical protein
MIGKAKNFFLFLFLFFLICPANAITFTLSPENPATGDEITIRGTATPNEILNPSITFEKTIGVVNGKYDYKLYGIKIPSGENNFAAAAQNATNLNVRVKMLLWWTKSADAVKGYVRVSQGNVPSGTYNVRIDGDAADGASSVPLTITASSKVTADPQGNFEYKYSSSGIPAGVFNLSIGGLTKTIILKEASNLTVTGSPAIPVSTPIALKPAEIPGFGIMSAIIVFFVLGHLFSFCPGKRVSQEK